MLYLRARQKVKDFDRWYAVFNSHAEAQKEAGFTGLEILRDVSDPNTVVVFFQVDDLEKARAFTKTPDADKAREQSGVIGRTEVQILREV